MNCGNCGNTVDAIHRFCPKCGAPVQFQAPPPASGSAYTPPSYSAPPTYAQTSLPPKQSSSCGKIIIIGVIILVLIGVGVAGAIYFGYRALERNLKNSEAYKVAVEKLKESTEVREKVGEIQDTGFPVGAYSQRDNGTGNATFVMSVQGTKAKGRYQVELLRRQSVWRVVNAVVTLDSGETIPVVHRGIRTEDEEINNTNEPPPPLPPFPSDPRSKPISGGILNGKATSLPQPIYPAAAKAVKASGTVMVRIVVDENGTVTEAQAVSGHPLLRAAAVAAARQAKFPPTKLAGKAVKVTGLLTYTFEAEK
jgi:TonB family protein